MITDRTILFRGWSTEKQRWVYGDLVSTIDGRGEPTGMFTIVNRGSGREYGFIAQESIGEFTGFQDEYFKMVFEGDILLSVNGGYKMEVVFHEFSFQGKVITKNIPFDYFSFTPHSKTRIIGNVYQGEYNYD